MLVIALAVFGALVVIAIYRLSNQTELLQDWERVLSPWAADIYREIGERVEAESKMAEYAYVRAFEAHAAGSLEEAIRLLEVGSRVVERTSPEMITLLRRITVMSRMASAVSNVPPLHPWTFHLPQLSGMALLQVVGHYAILSAAERFRLRAFILRRGFGAVTDSLLSSTEKIRNRRGKADPEWDRIAAARADLRTLATESLKTFQALLRSLAAEQT